MGCFSFGQVEEERCGACSSSGEDGKGLPRWLEMGNRFCTSWGLLSCHGRQRSFSALGVLLVPGGTILVIWFVDNVQFFRAVQITP